MDEIERIAQEVLRRLSEERASGARRRGNLPGEPADRAAPSGGPAHAAPPRPSGPGSAPVVGRIPVSISARHVHVTRSVLERLFGEGHELTKLRDVLQPGEFACEETVTIVGPSKRAIENVRILGPIRTYTQVELALTDAVRLGIDPPVRCSGDTAGTPPITLIGPRGTVALKEGAIRAMRHIHMTDRDARVFGVRDGDLVRVRFPGPKALVFENVLIRVAKAAALKLHLDTDDANAADVRTPAYVDILR